MSIVLCGLGISPPPYEDGEHAGTLDAMQRRRRGNPGTRGLEQLVRRRQVCDTRRAAPVVRADWTRGWRARRKKDERATPAVRIAADDDTGGRGPLVCATCGQRITDEDHRVERGGGHEHTFVNPGGFVYHVACFAVATGCSYAGDPETAFSWFPGYSWQIAACGACRALLGWQFRSSDDVFHGLIVEAIRPA
jgi:hypothetical protein